MLFIFLFQLFYIILLKWVDPPITITQLAAVWRGDGLKRTYISYDQIPENVKLAVIASEDQLFPDHNGFDFASMEKALKHNSKGKSIRGASTISQQVAKNVFLWQGRSYFRKVLEVYFTFMIEWIWGKKRIFAVYLNVAEMGKGIYGIESAAEYYFNKHTRQLTNKEAAKIAACLPNPVQFTIKPLSQRVAKRYPWILTQMNILKKDSAILQVIE